MRFPLAVIPAGGKGTRMGPGPSKGLRLVNGEPLIRHVVRFWIKLAERVRIIVPFENLDDYCEALSDSLLADEKERWACAPEREQQGVCHAILHGLSLDGAPPGFVVALGDCLFDGEFRWPVERPLAPFTGLGVMQSADSDFARSYAVGDCALIEKPLLGLGAYFLRWSDIRILERHMGITGVMAELDRISEVRRIFFLGKYRNCTYQEDLERW